MRQLNRTILAVGVMGLLGAGGWFTAAEIKAGDLHNRPSPSAAIGKCTYSGCSCNEFRGVYRCDNCGHGNSWHL
jgi:hypothetical protein